MEVVQPQGNRPTMEKRPSMKVKAWNSIKAAYGYSEDEGFQVTDDESYYSEAGKSEKEIKALRKRRGLCPDCGIRTHAKTGREPLKNENVYYGICKKCNPQADTPAAYAAESTERRDSLKKAAWNSVKAAYGYSEDEGYVVGSKKNLADDESTTSSKRSMGSKRPSLKETAWNSVKAAYGYSAEEGKVLGEKKLVEDDDGMMSDASTSSRRSSFKETAWKSVKAAYGYSENEGYVLGNKKDKENQGVCPTCGIRTHAVSSGEPLKNDNVYYGICKKCKPDEATPQAYAAAVAEREQQGKDRRKSLKKTAWNSMKAAYGYSEDEGYVVGSKKKKADGDESTTSSKRSGTSRRSSLKETAWNSVKAAYGYSADEGKVLGEKKPKRADDGTISDVSTSSRRSSFKETAWKSVKAAYGYSEDEGYVLGSKGRSGEGGKCSKCGIRTHATEGGEPLKNSNVHYGVCIKCNPDEVTYTVRKAWEEKAEEAGIDFEPADEDGYITASSMRSSASMDRRRSLKAAAWNSVKAAYGYSDDEGFVVGTPKKRPSIAAEDDGMISDVTIGSKKSSPPNAGQRPSMTKPSSRRTSFKEKAWNSVKAAYGYSDDEGYVMGSKKENSAPKPQPKAQPKSKSGVPAAVAVTTAGAAATAAVVAASNANKTPTVSVKSADGADVEIPIGGEQENHLLYRTFEVPNDVCQWLEGNFRRDDISCIVLAASSGKRISTFQKRRSGERSSSYRRRRSSTRSSSSGNPLEAKLLRDEIKTMRTEMQEVLRRLEGGTSDTERAGLTVTSLDDDSD